MNRRLREIRYAARRALHLEHAVGSDDADVWRAALRALRDFRELDDHLARGEQLPEPWAEAARYWDYASPESREHYRTTGAYLRVDKRPEPEPPQDLGPSNVVPFRNDRQPR